MVGVCIVVGVCVGCVGNWCLGFGSCLFGLGSWLGDLEFFKCIRVCSILLRWRLSVIVLFLVIVLGLEVKILIDLLVFLLLFVGLFFVYKNRICLVLKRLFF